MPGKTKALSLPHKNQFIRQENHSMDFLEEYGENDEINQLFETLHSHIQKSNNQRNLPIVHHNWLTKAFRFTAGIIFFPYVLIRYKLIKEGEIGLVWKGGNAKFIDKPGYHMLWSPLSRFAGIKEVTETYIELGPIKILQVPPGKIGYATNTKTGRLVFFARGRHMINDASVLFTTDNKLIDLQQKVHNLGSVTLVRIDTGEVGLISSNGIKNIIKPGWHYLEAPRKFEEFLNTQIKTLPLQGGNKEDTLILQTNDFISLSIKADLAFRINDPLKVTQEIEGINEQLCSIAIQVLSGLIRQSALKDICSIATTGEAHQLLQNPSGEVQEYKKDFYSILNHKFLSEMKANPIISNLNISIIDLRLNSLRFTEESLTKEFSKISHLTAQTKVELDNAEAQQQVKMIKAQTEANVKRIETAALKNYFLEVSETEKSFTLAAMKEQTNMYNGPNNKVLFIPQQGIGTTPNFNFGFFDSASNNLAPSQKLALNSLNSSLSNDSLATEEQDKPAENHENLKTNNKLSQIRTKPNIPIQNESIPPLVPPSFIKNTK